MAETFDSIRYRDHNGVWWRIITPPGGRMFAHVDQEGQALVYNPEPPDVGPVSRLRVVGEDAAMERQVLMADIEEEVKDLSPSIVVTASRDKGIGGWLIIGLFCILALSDESPRRGRRRRGR